MIVILRHTIMNQWSWLQVFMMFQKISMLSSFYYNVNTSFTDILCYFGRFEPSTDSIKMQACEVYGINKMRAKDSDASDIYM